MSQTISFKSNFFQTDCHCLRMLPWKPFSDFCLFCQGFLKYHYISKTRVFEKRFSQLHCVIFRLLSVKNSSSMSQTISFKSNFFQTDCHCLRMLPWKPFSDFCLFCQGFLKYHYISKTRVFEKRFSQLHCVIFCLFSVKNSSSISRTISFKSNFFQTDCHCLRMFPFEAIFRFLSILSRFFKISRFLIFEKRFSQLDCVIFCLFTVKNSSSMSQTIFFKSNFFQTDCYYLRMLPFEALFQFLSILSRFFKISPHL